MYTIIARIKLSDNCSLQIVTINYLQHSPPKGILSNEYGEILLSEQAILEICVLYHKLTRILKQICIRGYMSYYIGQENWLITKVELERHWDYKKLKFISSWAIETYNYLANSDAKLTMSKRMLRMLHKASTKINNAFEYAHEGMLRINNLSKNKKRYKLQSLAIECKWCIFKHLRKHEYLTQETLNTLPRNLQAFLRNTVFLE